MSEGGIHGHPVPHLPKRLLQRPLLRKPDETLREQLTVYVFGRDSGEETYELVATPEGSRTPSVLLSSTGRLVCSVRVPRG